ncbi:MAG: hypothetical protein ACR2HJ_12580 [Fimbriimonadales bacterium]
MNLWKRALIWWFTFGFGLVWVLAFLLPTEIGGGLDGEGMRSPCLIGKRLYYTTGRKPLIAMMDLDRTAVRSPAFSPSITRRHDYNGASNPTVFRDGESLRMIYLGLGFDFVYRVCVAESQDGTNWQPLSEPIFEPPATVAISGPPGLSMSADRRRLYYTVFENGRVVIRYAERSEGRWRDMGHYLRLEEPLSVLALSEMPDGRAVIVAMGEAGDAFPAIVNKVLHSTPVAAEPIALERFLGTAPPQFSGDLLGIVTATDGGLWRVLVTGTPSAADPRPRVSLYQGTRPGRLTLADGAVAGAVAELPAPARTTYFNDWAATLSEFVPIVSAFGFGLGLISLVGVHGRKIGKGGEPAIFSAIVLAALAAMLVVQLNFFYRGKPETGIWSDLNQILFYRLQFPLGSTMFGLLAAYLTSAAYRAFRIRTLDAAILAGMAAFVILTQVPTGQFLASLFAPGAVDGGARLDAYAVEGRNWALSIANDAVQRAVGFGAFVGAIAMAMRVWLSLDKTSQS